METRKARKKIRAHKTPKKNEGTKTHKAREYIKQVGT